MSGLDGVLDRIKTRIAAQTERREGESDRQVRSLITAEIRGLQYAADLVWHAALVERFAAEGGVDSVPEGELVLNVRPNEQP